MKSKVRKQFQQVVLSQEEKLHFISEIQYFFKKERGEDLGLIASEVILDFFLDTMGNTLYNKALDDARLWFSERLNAVEHAYDDLYRQK